MRFRYLRIYEFFIPSKAMSGFSVTLNEVKYFRTIEEVGEFYGI